jgi:predicted Zn-dependent protease
VLPDALKFASIASGEARVSYADYFNKVGQPGAAAALLEKPKLPVTHENARFDAVLAQSLALGGKTAQAKQLFDQVLDREPDQAEALRGRSMLAARTGLTREAIVDAQRLVTISPDSAEDRILLAQAYRASGNQREALRTLWDAFQDLPDDERVVTALQKALASVGDVDGRKRLVDEYEDRRKAKLTKELG